MKRFAMVTALLIALGVSALPASARDVYVTDNAGLLSASTVAALNAKIGEFHARTHKEVVVDIESTVTGDPKSAAESTYAQQQINGFLIFIAKNPKTIGVIPDRAAASYFPAGSTEAIRTAIASGFNAGNFDEGVTNGVDLTLNMYRSHLGALHRVAVVDPIAAPVPVVAQSNAGGGFNPMSLIVILIVLAVIFFIVRGIFRAMTGPRMMPPGYGGPPPMGGGYGYGGGYGPGYGGGPMGGGGGGFFSGLLGGLGGAWLGNELFGGNRETIIEQPVQQAGFVDGGQGNYGGDASGFQSDPGQADMGNSSFGSWGGGDNSGGGWGGGDSGGWGGDSGGGDNSGGGGW